MLDKYNMHMRNLLNLIKSLEEAAVPKTAGSKGINATNITKIGNEKRIETFLHKIKTKDPFTLLTSPDEEQQEVIIDFRELPRIQQMIADGTFVGDKVQLRTTSGDMITIDQLAKTSEFGGQAAKYGEEAGKEGLLVKPSQIKITDRNIPAHDLLDEIVNNPVLLSTDYGQVIIQLAKYIEAGEYVMLPKEYNTAAKKKVRTAIIDYAGEYLGVLSLLWPGASRFPRRKEFEEWLGASIGETTFNFPAAANNNLADSFAIISNPDTSHTLNISSKGTGGGAAPAISGLKVPDHVANDPNFKDATGFIEICQTLGTVPQAFEALDFVYRVNPKAISKRWHEFLPFSSRNPSLQERAKQSLTNRSALPQQYSVLYSDIKSDKATDGGKLIYSIKKEVASAINDRDAIPEFKVAVLQILQMNFVQQYADYKNGEIKFETQWPAKLHGTVSVVNKSSATEPTAGGFSFKLGRVTEADEPGVDGDAGAPATGDEAETDFMAGAGNIAGGRQSSSDVSSDDDIGVGRKKQKR